jgi:very-short-patch-repair endonuclease
VSETVVHPSVFTLKERARRLRREQTDAERKLWARLRSRQLDGFKFRRQFVIGPFITDFCCFEQRLVVELDGGQHADQSDSDRRRSDFLLSHGYRVLRFWDNQVMENIDSVLEQILLALDKAVSDGVPSPFPLPKGAYRYP